MIEIKDYNKQIQTSHSQQTQHHTLQVLCGKVPSDNWHNKKCNAAKEKIETGQTT